jgi:hypothetical protein
MLSTMVGPLLVLLPAAPLPANDKPDVLAGPSPRIVLARVDKDGTFLVREQSLVFELRQETVTEQKDGKPVTVTRTVTVAVPVVRQWQLPRQTEVVGVDGKPIDRDAVARLLRKDRLVVVTVGTAPEAYRRLFKDGTLFLVAPALPGPPVTPTPLPKPPVQRG